MSSWGVKPPSGQKVSDGTASPAPPAAPTAPAERPREEQDRRIPEHRRLSGTLSLLRYEPRAEVLWRALHWEQGWTRPRTT